jgi:hypothetical protein
MLIGWMYNGHDTYYPEYNAIPDLGGDKALVAAIDQAHAAGASVTAYVNGRLNNIETETYKKFGKRWAVLGMAPRLGVGTIDFYELHEDWNKQWERAKRGEGWYSVMCPSAKGWQDFIVGQVLHVVRDYHFDGVFLDQPGSYYAELCYNKTHGHTTPATAWGPGYLEIFRRIRAEARKINPEFTIYTEGMNDAYGEFLDYHTDKNPLWEPMRTHPEMETFVEMWRYTVPAYVTSNGPNGYTYPPSRDATYGDYYRFVMGIRGIGRSGGRGAANPARDAVVSKIERLWTKGGEFLFYGRFMDNVGLAVSSPAMFAKVYQADAGIAVPVWNVTAEDAKGSLTIDLNALGLAEAAPAGAASLDTGSSLEMKTQGGRLVVPVALKPHDADVIVFRKAK